MPSSQEIPDLEQYQKDSELTETTVEVASDPIEGIKGADAPDPLAGQGELALAALQEQPAAIVEAAEVHAPASEGLDPVQRRVQFDQLLDALPSTPSDDSGITALANFLNQRP